VPVVRTRDFYRCRLFIIVAVDLWRNGGSVHRRKQTVVPVVFALFISPTVGNFSCNNVRNVENVAVGYLNTRQVTSRG